MLPGVACKGTLGRHVVFVRILHMTKHVAVYKDSTGCMCTYRVKHGWVSYVCVCVRVCVCVCVCVCACVCVCVCVCVCN